MALLGSFIDSRTIVSLASNASTTFAHGLPAAPDFVLLQPTGAATTSASATSLVPRSDSDATSVSLFGGGLGSPALRIISVVAHSVVR